jgi:hypothetical protein
MLPLGRRDSTDLNHWALQTGELFGSARTPLEESWDSLKFFAVNQLGRVSSSPSPTTSNYSSHSPSPDHKPGGNSPPFLRHQNQGGEVSYCYPIAELECNNFDFANATQVQGGEGQGLVLTSAEHPEGECDNEGALNYRGVPSLLRRQASSLQTGHRSIARVKWC